MADVASGRVHRVDLATGAGVEIASGVGGADGVVRDAKGRIYIGDVRGGKVFRIDSPARSRSSSPTVSSRQPISSWMTRDASWSPIPKPAR